MIELSASYYDGKTSASQQVKLVVLDSSIEIIGESFRHSYHVDQVTLQPRLANIAARFEFHDGVTCEVSEQPGLDEVYKIFHQGSFHKIVHKLENKLHYIFLTLFIAIVMIWLLVHYGIPVLAKSIAFEIPIEYEKQMGQESLELIDTAFCKPSKLNTARQKQLREKMRAMLEKPENYQVEFRFCKVIGANALAMPSGIIIYTDDMVNMAHHDEELLGIFAHEIAHVEYRHTLRHILQDSIAGLLIVVLTGDIGSASSLAAAAPTVLLQAKFSRDFEREADIYAAGFMIKQGLQPAHLANILERLEKEYGSDEESMGFLSTHPLTKERIKYLTEYNNK